jgi:membrane associated rhomboid family serine protease
MRGQMNLPTIDRVNKAFIIALVSVFLINAFSGFADISLFPYLSLSLGSLASGKVWTLFTYVFLPGGLIELIFNALIIWFIGSELSSGWGEKRYLQFILATTLGAAIISLGINAAMSSMGSLSGASAFCSALCVAYGVLNPDRTMYFFFFPLQAKWFVAILVGMNLYNGIFSSTGGILAWSQLGAMACGYTWMVWISSPRKKISTKQKKSNLKNSHLSIVKEAAEEPEDKPTYH